MSSSILVLAGVGLFLITRSFVLEAIARPHIEATIGGEIEIGHVRWLSLGELEILDLSVRAPGWKGAAGEVIRVDRATIELDARALRAGAFKIDRVEIDGMLVRVAERGSDPGVFNFHALQPELGDGGGGQPPARIDIKNLELQMGVDQDGTWERSGSVELSGELVAEPRSPGKFVIQFVTQPRAGKNQSVLKGEIDIRTLAFNASIDDLAVDENLLGMMPIELRRITESMDLSGHVDRVETAWDGKNTLHAAIDLGKSQLTIPQFEEENTWSILDAGVLTTATRPPMIEVHSGRIALSDDRLTLEQFEGRLRGSDGASDAIPVRLDFHMDLAPILSKKLDWTRGRAIAEQAFRIAPFSLNLMIPDFKIKADSEGIVLPTAAARALSEFGAEEWELHIKVDLARDLPIVGEDGTRTPAELHTTGRVTVKNGSGRYSRFPFPLEHVRAYIEFDDVSVNISYLIGNGPNGGSVEVTGVIINPGPSAEIDVRVIGNDVPADRVFRSALDGWRRRTWDRFFDAHAERQMHDAGLLPGQETVETARRERTELLLTLRDLPPEDEVERKKLQKRAEKLKRVIKAGPFEMGGLFGFDLRVTSAAGSESPVHLTGDITIIKGDVILSDFPYPIHLYDSTIRLEPEDIVLGQGVSFVTPDGGTGVIRGSIHNPDTGSEGGPVMIPDITFAAIDVSVTPTLLAALPPSGEDEPIDPGSWPGRWRSEGARAMAGLGLAGLLDLEGSWRGNHERPEEDPILQFDAHLGGGSITPHPDLAEFFAEAGIIWPEGFQLSGCTANVHLDPTIVRMSNFEGSRKGGIVTANGFISRLDDAEELEVAFRSIQLEEYLLDLVPEGPRNRARELWDRFQPRGMFDADLDWTQDFEGKRTSIVRAEPDDVLLNMNGTDVSVKREHGVIIIEGDEIRLEDLLLRLTTPRLTHAVVALDGAYGRPFGDVELQLRGEIEEGHFESPVIPVMLDLFDSDRLLESWFELEPSGRFEARFEYRGLSDERTDYSIDLVPSSISATIGEDRLHAVFDDGLVFISPSRVDMERLLVRIPAPGTVEINGTVTFGEKIDLLATADYDLQQLPLGASAYLPVPLSMGFESIDFTTNARFQLHDCSISGTWAAGAPIEEPDLYDFAGEIEYEQAKFTAGTSFDRFDGHAEVHLRAEQEPTGRLALHLLGLIEGEHIDVQSRRITKPSARLEMVGDDVLRILDISGSIAGGRTVAEIAIDLEARSWELEVSLEDASLEELSHGRDEPTTEGTIGRVLANVRLFGLIDSPESKRGRGRILIEEGKMTNSPLTLSIVQLSQFMLPVSDSLDFAEIAFTVEGDRMVFDEFLLSSPTLQFFGEGEMSMGDWELALRLFPRGTVPILSDLIGGVTGTLYAINIGGTLGEPEASVEPLPLLGGRATIKGSNEREQERPREQTPSSRSGDSG